MVMHPAMLDVAFQTLFVALAYPASGQVTLALLPSHIDRVRVSPLLPKRSEDGEVRADFESWEMKPNVTSLIGDLNVYDTVSGQTLAQVEGLALNCGRAGLLARQAYVR
ncbi:hypothetical protein BDV23DRAFT_180923 [Aspergillus alliaceus]|uniref:PKS/mFAS DH domain-containing protein n=1 Tax=Petromyces alliaceus TaxID=209559 RepID=A0A5N7CG39_PETAA|nr:hypothetical protein BDV23DRAFT_180923 [Aspergillus alliaceus]